MAVECLDFSEICEESFSIGLTESVDNIEFEVKKELPKSGDIITIPEARDCIKDKFATYHKLLDDRESELLAELELLEETNKPEINHVRSDLVRLRGIVDSFNDSLGTNTLKVFHDKQRSLWEEQITEMERSEHLLSHVTLDISDENFVENLIKVTPYLSKAKFRTELISLLLLEPNLGEDWYVMSNNWFSEFADSINLTNPQPNDAWEFPLKIPIQTTNGIQQLHSKAWDMLLSFNGLSPGSIPIKRLSYLNETTNKIEIPKRATKHKCTIGHNYGKNKFSIECEIEAFPYETYKDILKKLSEFSTLFTKHLPNIYTFDQPCTISLNSQNSQYTVDYKTQVWPIHRSYQDSVPVQDTRSFIGITAQLFLIIIPDSTGSTCIGVRK